MNRPSTWYRCTTTRHLLDQRWNLRSLRGLPGTRRTSNRLRRSKKAMTSDDEMYEVKLEETGLKQGREREQGL